MLPAMPFPPAPHLGASWTKTDARKIPAAVKFVPCLLKSADICVLSVDTLEGRAAVQEG